MIRNARHLRHLSLGCIGELTDQMGVLLPLLALHQSSTLEGLHIASVKEDPDSYGIIDFSVEHIRTFHNLNSLGIDYDYLNNDLLLNLAGGNRAKLEKLIIHVHGIEPDHEKIRNMTWYHLVHSIDGAARLLDILRPDMPLAHLRMFFCQDLNVAAINFIARNNYNTLQSLHIIDGMDDGQPYHYTMEVGVQDEEDPFVMLAWKCIKLRHFTLIG